MELENLKSRHQLENTLVDKLGIAIIFTIVGYAFNKRLERYKLLEAQRKEWGSKRIETSSAVWKAAHALEGRIRALQQFAPNAPFSYADSNRLRDKIGAIAAEAEALKALLDENRFLLGRATYARCCAYRRLLSALLHASVGSDSAMRGKIERALSQLHSDLDSSLEAQASAAPRASN